MDQNLLSLFSDLRKTVNLCRNDLNLKISKNDNRIDECFKNTELVYRNAKNELIKEFENFFNEKLNKVQTISNFQLNQMKLLVSHYEVTFLFTYSACLF